MYLLYLDEFGHPGPYDPTDQRYQHHPLFGFAGFVLPSRRWRDFDRSYLRLKERFYRNEIQQAQTLKGLRPERFEPKKLKSRRDIRFVAQVFGLVGKCGGRVFAIGRVTQSDPKKHSYVGLYNSTVQSVLRAYEKYLQDPSGGRGQAGLVIMDRRTEAQNQRVLESAQSMLFSHEDFRKSDVCVAETPLLVPSDWYHGVQAADGIGRAVAAIYWYRKMGNPKFKRFEDKLGPVLRAHTHSIGGWHSVFVR